MTERPTERPTERTAERPTERTADRPPFWSRSRVLVVALCVGVTVFVGANAHLLAVSFSSQPDCVPHLKAPKEGAAQFRAAMSSC